MPGDPHGGQPRRRPRPDRRLDPARAVELRVPDEPGAADRRHEGRRTGHEARRLPCRLEQQHARYVVVGALEEGRVTGVHPQSPRVLLRTRRQDHVLVAGATGARRGHGRGPGHRCGGSREVAAHPPVDLRTGEARRGSPRGSEPSGAAHGPVHLSLYGLPAAELQLGTGHFHLQLRDLARHAEVVEVAGVVQRGHQEVVAHRHAVAGVEDEHRRLTQGLGDQQRIVSVPVDRCEERVVVGQDGGDREPVTALRYPADRERVLHPGPVDKRHRNRQCGLFDRVGIGRRIDQNYCFGHGSPPGIM